MSANTRRKDICSAVAQILREERLKRFLSLSTVAERAGLSHQMVSFVEREVRNPTLETLVRITDALEIDLAEVVKRAYRIQGDSRRLPKKS